MFPFDDVTMSSQCTCHTGLIQDQSSMTHHDDFGTPWRSLSCHCNATVKSQAHDDVMTWKHFPPYSPFGRGTTGLRWIPLTKHQLCEALMFPCCWSEQNVEKTVDWFWMANLLMWFHCNATFMHYCHPCREATGQVGHSLKEPKPTVFPYLWVLTANEPVDWRWYWTVA